MWSFLKDDDSCEIYKKTESDDEHGEQWVQCEASCQRWFFKVKGLPKGE